mgnify:CR=1 FL=1
MYQNLRWKTLSILAVAAIAIVAFYPPQNKIKLGLDLKGGLHLVLQVKTDDALRVETETSAEQLKDALKAKGFTIVMVEQNFRFAAPLADRFYVMEHGQIIEGFAAAELQAKMPMLHEYLGV